MLKRNEEAVASYQKYLTRKPEDADAWTHQGIALVELKRDAEALASFDRAVALHPTERRCMEPPRQRAFPAETLR